MGHPYRIQRMVLLAILILALLYPGRAFISRFSRTRPRLAFSAVADKLTERHQYWVVLVDDEESIRQSVGDLLYDAGFQVTACANAGAFFKLKDQLPDASYQDRTPDAVVSDVRMPGMDGISFVKELKNDVRLKKVPIVMLTAKGMTNDRIEGYRAGADVYLSKPFNPDELISVLDNLIKRRNQVASSSLSVLKEEMDEIKDIMKKRQKTVVKKTQIYLTPVEREVLALIADGLTNTEIAEERGMNPKNLQKLVQKLYKETGTETRTGLVRWAIETGYVPKTRL